jgi:hypothetical protein
MLFLDIADSPFARGTHHVALHLGMGILPERSLEFGLGYRCCPFVDG